MALWTQLSTDLLFAWPWAWCLLPLPVLMWCWPKPPPVTAALRAPWPRQPLHAAAAIVSFNIWRGLRLFLLWLVWFWLCAATARPQHLGPLSEPPQQIRRMMLALDLSGSMRETDMHLGNQAVDRLTAAKAVLADFLKRREGDHIGLLVFGSRAYTLTPLTRDLVSVRAQLHDSVVGLPGEATAIGDVIGLAVKRLSEHPEGERVLILLTDGDNNAGLLEPLKAAELAAAEHVRVHTIAFGGDARQGRRFSRGQFAPSSGQAHGMDEDTLIAIAQKTGGLFFRARNTSELVGIYTELDRIEPIEIEGVPVRPRIERYYWPLLFAFLIGLPVLLWPEPRS